MTVHWDADQPVDLAALHGILRQQRASAWSGVTVGGSDSFDGVWLRLTATQPGTCRIAASLAAVTAGSCTPAIPTRSPAVIQGNSLAYLALRPQGEDGGQRRWELGAIGHGLAGPRLGESICESIRVWDRDRTATPTVTAYPAATPDERLGGGEAIRKRDSLLVVSY